MNLVQELHQETTSPSIKSLVAEVDNQVIGYVSYSPIFLKSDSSISGYILAPLAVSPEHQKQGVGSNLIKSGIDMLTKDGAWCSTGLWRPCLLWTVRVQGRDWTLISCRHTHCNIHLVGQV
jgi:predicted N-acetyltransferase YhbS